MKRLTYLFLILALSSSSSYAGQLPSNSVATSQINNPIYDVKKKAKALPVITKLSSQTDQTKGGKRITITGKNFPSNSRLLLGDTEVKDLTVKSSTKIIFRVPAELFPGARTLTIRTADGVTQQPFEITSTPFGDLGGVEITTKVGGVGYVGDGLMATDARTTLHPDSIFLDGNSNIYISDTELGRVRRVDGQTGMITTIAGNGMSGDSGDNGSAIDALLSSPTAIKIDKDDNIFIVDRGNGRVRRIGGRSKLITTIAGNGNGSTFNGDNIPATEASLSASGITVNARGDLFIADPFQCRIRKVDADTGLITTIAGTGAAGFSGDGGPANMAQIANPQDVAIDDTGNIYFADTGNGRIRRINASDGIISTLAGIGIGDSTDDNPAINTPLSPTGLAVDKSGNILIAESALDPIFNPEVSLGRVRRLDVTTGKLSTVVGSRIRTNCGDGGQATSARFALPAKTIFFQPTVKATIDEDGNIYIPDNKNFRVRRIDAETGIITTIAGNGYPGDVNTNAAATESRLFSPTSVAVDPSGNIFIADANFIYRINNNGIISLFAGNGRGFMGDGGPAVAAGLSGTLSIAFDNVGDMIIADTMFNRVRKIDMKTTIITTLAGNGSQAFQGDNNFADQASVSLPTDIAIDKDNNLFIADMRNHRIRRVDGKTKIITTVAGNGKDELTGDGGPALMAGVGSPNAILVDQGGNIFITDPKKDVVRRIDARTKIITTLVGNGEEGFSGDGDLATRARLSAPSGLIMDAEGNLIIIDSGNNALRIVREVVKNFANF